MLHNKIMGEDIPDGSAFCRTAHSWHAILILDLALPKCDAAIFIYFFKIYNFATVSFPGLAKIKNVDAVGIEPTTFHNHTWKVNQPCEAKIIPLDHAPGLIVMNSERYIYTTVHFCNNSACNTRPTHMYLANYLGSYKVCWWSKSDWNVRHYTHYLFVTVLATILWMVKGN